VNKDQVIGAGIFVVSIVVILVYIWLTFFTPWSYLVLQITATVAVGGVLGILAWIGYTLATTPPPKPIEEIEKELDEELKKIEEEQKEKSGKK
jgi:predicted DNA-binding transcriptional regulator